MDDYLVSVIIPVYNAEKYICECLDSVLAQTFKSIQIIAIDDGSTDKTPQILDEYAKKHENIEVYHQKNAGIAKARQAGYSHAVGNYISWCDADDFMKSNMIETTYSEAESKKADIVICNYSFYPQKVGTKAKWFKQYGGGGKLAVY